MHTGGTENLSHSDNIGLTRLESGRKLQGQQVAVEGNPDERVVLSDNVPGDALLRQNSIADDSAPRHPVHRELVLLLRPASLSGPLASCICMGATL